MLKRVLSTITALFLLVGTTGLTGVKTYAEANAKDANTFTQYTSGPFDANIANEEKVIEMLQKSGKIKPDATYEEAKSIYLKFLQDGAKANLKYKSTKFKRKQAPIMNAAGTGTSQSSDASGAYIDPNAKKVKVLVLLVEFQDYKHNSIQQGESDNYYPSFEPAHYKDLLFSSAGLPGPTGGTLVSARQYYAQQSGGSLDFNGDVYGWYKLPNIAAYYGAHTAAGDNDIRPRDMIKDALNAAVQDPTLNLANYDLEDPNDFNNNGNFNEPDGVIDYLMVFHAGLGEDEGGGQLGENAIWSHSWDLGGVYQIPGTNLSAYSYTTEPENAAAGVCSHEFGHNLGLPDEYDTIYSSETGEPISFWSIMSGGSWGGAIQGTEPSGFSPYAKQLFQDTYGGNWQNLTTINYENLSDAGTSIALRQADENGQAVRINLPERTRTIVQPKGVYSYWGGTGKDGSALRTNMTTTLDLTGKKNVVLTFDTSYDIEDGWDFASVQARESGTQEWTYLKGSNTTTGGNVDRSVIVPNGITGKSAGWVNVKFSLNSFAGKNIELRFEYQTDEYSYGTGFYVDNITVAEGKKQFFTANGEEAVSPFIMNNFKVSDGTVTASQYYLIEWRNHHGVDTGLGHIAAVQGTISFDPGMVVWYVDEYYTDNWTGVHPGGGYLSVVDADQTNQLWEYANTRITPFYASQRYQMHDAAFSKANGSTFSVTNPNDKKGPRTVIDKNTSPNMMFNDATDYSNPQIPTLGVKLVNYGLNIGIIDQASDNSGATILIKKQK